MTRDPMPPPACADGQIDWASVLEGAGWRAQVDAADGGLVRLTPAHAGGAALLRLAPADAPPKGSEAHARAPAHLPEAGLRRAAGLAWRRAGCSAALAAVETAADAAGFRLRQPIRLQGPPRALFLGAAQPGFLALRQALDRRGISLDAALTPVSALEHAQAGRADLVMADAGPGQARARSILAALRRSPHSASLPVIAFGPALSAEHTAQLYAAGAALTIASGSLGRAETADWIARLIADARKARATEEALAAWADASLAETPPARALRAGLAERLAGAGAVRLRLGPLRAGVKRLHAIAMARRVLRPSDWVFALGADGLGVMSPAYAHAARAAITQRANTVLFHAGLMDEPSPAAL